jgi:hypothetical protein
LLEIFEELGLSKSGFPVAELIRLDFTDEQQNTEL